MPTRTQNRTPFARLLHQRSRPARRVAAIRGLETLEIRQLLTAAQFVGITAPQGSSQLQHVVTFDSNTPTTFTDKGTLTGVSNGFLMEALSRDPVSNTYYGFAVDGEGQGQVYGINIDTAVATPLGSSVLAGFSQTPNSFYAKGDEFAYVGDQYYDFNNLGQLVDYGTITGSRPLAQAGIIGDINNDAAAYGFDDASETYTGDGRTFNSAYSINQGFATTVGLQVTGANQHDYTAYATGTIMVDSTPEYDLFFYTLAGAHLDKIATLPQALYGFADRVLMPTFDISGISGNVAAGSTQSITVTADPGDGSIDTNYTGTVHFTSSDPTASLPADVMLTHGTGTFDVTFRTAGAQTVTVTDTTDPTITATASGITVTPGPTTHYTLTGATPVVAGTTETITVNAIDAYGNLNTNESTDVSTDTSDRQATLPANVTLTSGTGTFDVTFRTATSQSITVTAGDPSINGTVSGITVHSAAAEYYQIIGGVNTTAGSVENYTIIVSDAFNNLVSVPDYTVAISTSDSQATAQSSIQFSDGIGTFSVIFKTAGLQSVTAADPDKPAISRTASNFITAAAATHLVVNGATDQTAGANQLVTVSAFDAYGNLATDTTGPVQIASSDPQATLPGLFTLIGGTRSFALTLKTAGTQSITATSGELTQTQGDLIITAASATRFAVAGPATVTAGTPGFYTLTSYDPYNNLVTDYEGIVHVTSSDGQAIKPPDFNVVHGVRTFDVILKSAGVQYVTVSDSIDKDLAGKTSEIVVTAATLDHIHLDVSRTATAGQLLDVTLAGFDAFGNVATAANDAVNLTSSDPLADFPSSVVLAAGVATFSYIPATTGLQTLNAFDATAPLGLAVSSINVTPGVVAQLVLTGIGNAVAGTVQTVTITALDAFGNVATGDSGLVHFTSSDPTASLPTDAALVGGVGTFTVTIKQGGPQTVAVNAILNPSVSGSISHLVVTAAALDQIVLNVTPTATAGSPLSVTLTGFDAFGNLATAANDTVNLTSTDPLADFPSSVVLAAGGATFSFLPRTAGPQTLTATDGTNPLGQVVGVINVAASAVVRLVLTGIGNAVAGTVQTVTITALDAFGNVATGDSGLIHFTSSDPTAVLPADAALVNGVGTFAVALKRAGTSSVTATATADPTLTKAISGITVTAAAATQLVLTGPAVTVVGMAQTYTVTRLDAFGNVVLGSNTVHLTSTDPAATLPASVTLTNGVGTFTATLATRGLQTITGAGVADPSVAGSLAGISVQADISGTVFLDSNGNGVLDAGEVGLADRVLYLDLSNSGSYQVGDPTTITDAAGHFAFTGIVAGSAVVRQADNQGSITQSVVTGIATRADSTLTIGLVPVSPVAIVPVLPNPFVGNPGTTTDSRYIQALYRTVLGRNGTDAEVAGWQAKLDAGITPQQISAGFVDSLEHRTNEVAAYYQTFLHRATDPGAATWVNQLMSGVSEQSVAAQILASAEYQAAHTDSSLYVRDLYLDVLGRQATDAEVASWQVALSTGTSRTDLAVSFVGSDEANDQVVASLYHSALRRSREVQTSEVWSSQLGQNVAAADVAIGILASDEFVTKAKASKAS